MIGRLIRRLRSDRGMTQRELARRVGVSEHTIRRWESGETVPSLERLGPLCRALGVRPDVFMNGG